ncbi:MAG: hypothetical protein MI741_22065, partial [Rhodospirillales bacterium]|nr:hypothetical protein [Rhodospirillales bacterium]
MFARAPLPLGAETFGEKRRIPDETAARLGLTLIGFRALILAQNPRAWGAFATAALREAQNCDAVAKDIRDKTSIPIRILSGRDEAEIVGRHVARQFPNAAALICADIGGGSADAAFIQNGQVKSAASFRVGTNRADPKQHPREFARMEKWLADKA